MKYLSNMARRATPPEQHRSRRIGIPVKESEYELIDEEARFDNTTTADFCRRVLLEYIARRRQSRQIAIQRARYVAEQTERRKEMMRQDELRRNPIIVPPATEFVIPSGAEMRSAPEPEPPAATTPIVTAEERAAFLILEPHWKGLTDEQIDLVIQNRRTR